MKIDPNILKECELFCDIENDDIEKVLGCLEAKIKSCNKNEIILNTGDTTDMLSIVLSGKVIIFSDDYWGNRTIINMAFPSDIFGEAFSCIKNIPLPVSVIAAEKAEIMFISSQKIMSPCAEFCSFHNILFKNLNKILAKKNIALLEKISHITKRTTREKLISYLSVEAQKNKNDDFYIPFNREKLADYLSVDRSAMSNELCKMRDEGILSFEKNHFILHK